MINTIEREPEVVSAQSDFDNEDVRSFIELQRKWSTSIARQDKMDEIEEDKEILEELTEKLPTNATPQIKPSLYFKLMRIYDVQASDLPKTYARAEGKLDADLAIVNSLKDKIYNESGIEDVYVDVIQRFKTEGTAVVQLGFSDEGDYIPVETCELGEIFLDPEMTTIASHSNMKGRVAKTVMRLASVKYSEFLDMFPEMEGKVTSGSPAMEEVRDVFDRDLEDKSMKMTDKIGILYCYSIEDSKNPKMMIIAGGSGALCEEKSGKAYPFWKKRNKKELPFLPFVDFHYSRVKRGFYSMSMIGMMKDIAESYRKMLNAALPLFHKAVNKILFLFGAEDDQTVEEMQLAYEQQKLGLNPMIAVEKGVDVKAVGPDSGVFRDFQLAKQEVFAEASDRFDIDFQRLSSDEVKATVFVGKTKTELQAIAGLYTINKTKFDLLAEYVMYLASRHWDLDDSRIMDVSINDDIEITMSIGKALSLFAGFEGYFDTDVDLRMPTSSTDRANAISRMDQQVFNLFYGRPFKSEQEIELEIQSIAAQARMQDIDDIYTVSALKKKAFAMLQSQFATQSLGQGRVGGVEDESNRDVAQELAPQRALAQAGVL